MSDTNFLDSNDIRFSHRSQCERSAAMKGSRTKSLISLFLLIGGPTRRFAFSANFLVSSELANCRPIVSAIGSEASGFSLEKKS